MKHCLRALVEDKPSVLARVAGQMGRRNLNIDYFMARNLPGGGRTEIIIGFDADELLADRIAKSIARLVNVLEVTCRPGDPANDVSPIAAGSRETETPET